jgi:hypothetical protein
MRRLAAWRFAALTVGAAAGSAPLAVRFVALDGTTRVGGANGAVDLGTVAATRAIEVAVAADSVPPGHDLAGLAELPVQLAAGKPAAADFVVKAQRSIEGQVARATAEPATVIAEEIGRRVTADG